MSGHWVVAVIVVIFTIGLISFTPNEASGQAFDDVLFDNLFGHFVCYTHTNQTSPNFPVILDDQFEFDSTIVRNATQICAQAGKVPPPSLPFPTPSPFFFDQHYIVYNITETELFAPIATVNITDQFIFNLFGAGNVTANVFEARELWVPANKTHFGIDFPIDPQNEIHWKCYRLEQPNPIPQIDDIITFDQFTSDGHTAFFAGYLCNPVEKSLDGGTTFIGDDTIPDHLICYSINGTGFGIFQDPDLRFEDQFLNITDSLINTVRLCNTAAKAVLISGPGPVGAESLPINPVSLLVAGAYTSSVWILPLVAATVVGVLVFKKRKDK